MILQTQIMKKFATFENGKYKNIFKVINAKTRDENRKRKKVTDTDLSITIFCRNYSTYVIAGATLHVLP